jgi:Fe-Mn family superoxide dismutase
MSLIHAALPYNKDALEPYMSERTLDFHYGKHHRAYVENTIAAVAGTALAEADLESIIKTAAKSGDKHLFNNAAQAWNHDFFWNSMGPKRGGNEGLTGRLAEWIVRDIGGIDTFKASFKAEGIGHFASGWVWLVLEDGKLRITSYHDADTPLARDGVVPILTADVWEHAYYLDHQNARAAFLDAFLNHLANWRGAAAALENAIL